jgi:adenosylcobyric acid synthase
VETMLKAPKTTTLTRFRWQEISGSGYEIHMGQTHLKGGQPLFSVDTRNEQTCMEKDGCITADGRIAGTYMHGLFDSPGITRHWLSNIGLRDVQVPDIHGPDARDREYDLLAAHFSQYVDVEAIHRCLMGDASR